MRSVGLASPPREDLGLDRVDLEREALDHLGVVVDDAVGDGVEDGAGADAQEVRMRLEVEPDVVQRAALAVADGDHEARAGEDHQLADLDRLCAADVAGRLDHEEQRVADDLELRALVGVDGVLDRERVQLEAPADGLDDLRAGVVEADPHEAVAARVGTAERGLELDAAALPVALVVEPAVDDGGADVLDPRVRPLGRLRAVADAGVAARQREPGQTVGRHAASLTPRPAAEPSSSRDLDRAARESPCALDAGGPSVANVLASIDLGLALAALVFGACSSCSRARARMSAATVALVVALALFVYLLVALLRPERF